MARFVAACVVFVSAVALGACETVPCDGACGVDEVCERIVPCGPFGFLESDRLDDCVAPIGFAGEDHSCDALCGDDCGDDVTCVATEMDDGTTQLALVYEGCFE